MTVDEFVKSKVQPEFRPIVAAIRSLMKENAPRALEVMSYGLPMYSQKKPMAWISPSKTGISIGFREGVSFEDKYGLLRGAVKHAKHVKMKTLADVNRPALRYYIKQAVKIDNRWFQLVASLIAMIMIANLQYAWTLFVKPMQAATGWKLSDIERIEINEAFAAVPLAVAQELGLPEDVINVEGGAIAHGHPIGATGAVLTTRLIHSMRRDGLRRGIVTLCIGGGQGIALAIETTA